MVGGFAARRRTAVRQRGVRARRRRRRPAAGDRTVDGVRGRRRRGLTVTAQPVVDETRRLATVIRRCGRGRCGCCSSTVSRHGGPARLRDRAAVAVACDSLGLGRGRCSPRPSRMSKVRNQFGRPIGSFQAVKHACADMLVGIAVSRQLVGRGGRQPSPTDGTPGSPRRDGEVVRVLRPPSRSPARQCNCTAASATRGRAASTSISNAPHSTVRCSVRLQRTDRRLAQALSLK